jgi:proline dehydrogenase
MQLMRTTLLWMARNEWLGEHVPELPFARRAVRRFMPGEQVEDAFRAADQLLAQGVGIVFTRLGENLATLAAADAVAQHYHAVLDEAATRPSPPEISVKLTQLGLDIDAEACFRHSLDLARHAARVGSAFWIDMEGSDHTDATIDLYARIHAQEPSSGICLQAYLRRTAADVARLLPSRPAIRLVKGAYDEPASVAYRSRADVDANYLGLALTLATAAGRGEARLALGTHDSELVEQIATLTDAAGIPRQHLGVHMLYGVRGAELLRLRSLGYPVHSLIAYGDHWYAWYMRRLAERPANLLFALRQIVP